MKTLSYYIAYYNLTLFLSDVITAQYLRTSRWMKCVNKNDLHLFHGPSLSRLVDIGFITNLFAPFNKSLTGKFQQWEFHRATTWPLSCKSDLERNANFAGTDEYFKLYGETRRSLWKILSNLLHICCFYGVILESGPDIRFIQ